MPFVLRCPVTGLYFCDEPYVVTPARKKGDPPLVIPPKGCAVRRMDWATTYPTQQAAGRQTEALRDYPEICPLS